MKKFETGDPVLVSDTGRGWDVKLRFLYQLVGGKYVCQASADYERGDLTELEVWTYIKPVPKTETRVKGQLVMMEELTLRGYVPNSAGKFVPPASSSNCSFVPEMWRYCGKRQPDEWTWEPWMLEEVEVSE